MKSWRRLICFFLGHTSICLFRYHWGADHYTNSNGPGSETTSWQCERCGYTFTEQWDT